MTKTTDIVSKDKLDTLTKAMGWQFCQIGIYRRKYRLGVRLGDGRPAVLLGGSAKTKLAVAVEGMLALVELAGKVNVEATLAQATDAEILAQVHERDSLDEDVITREFWRYMRPSKKQFKSLAEEMFEDDFTLVEEGQAALADADELDRYKRVIAAVARGERVDFAHEFGMCRESLLLALDE